jgi:hypothetical protein
VRCLVAGGGKRRQAVAGRLGDGSSITGSLNLDEALACRMLILPLHLDMRR